MAVDRQGEGREWSDTWGCIVPAVVSAAIVVAFGSAVVATAETDDRRGSGWVLVVVAPLSALVVVGVVRWTRRAVESGRIVVGPVGRPVVGDDSWDPALGRRYLGLWYAGTLLVAAGAAAALWAPVGFVPVVLGLALYLLARNAQRRAMGLSAVEKLTLGPLSGLPVTLARRHEPGTWWARWAWVDLALEVAALVALIAGQAG